MGGFTEFKMKKTFYMFQTAAETSINQSISQITAINDEEG